MYVSCLLIDIGQDPDRPRPGRLWLRNLYHVHQRLCMAFPSPSRKRNDPEFLRPFRPADFGSDEGKQIHVARGPESGFLFRVDPRSAGRAVILVQSGLNPDWDYAFHNASHLLASGPEVKPFEAHFNAGDRLRFRLLANPTRKIETKSGPDGERRHGKRVPVPGAKMEDWLVRRGEAAGFSVNTFINVQAAHIYAQKSWNECPNCRRWMKEEGTEYVQCEECGRRMQPLRHLLLSARYDGFLKVNDPARFRETVIRGIGPGKAFGCGLLSLAPAGGGP